MPGRTNYEPARHRRGENRNRVAGATPIDREKTSKRENPERFPAPYNSSATFQARAEWDSNPARLKSVELISSMLTSTRGSTCSSSDLIEHSPLTVRFHTENAHTRRDGVAPFVFPVGMIRRGRAAYEKRYNAEGRIAEDTTKQMNIE